MEKRVNEGAVAESADSILRMGMRHRETQKRRRRNSLMNFSGLPEIYLINAFIYGGVAVALSFYSQGQSAPFNTLFNSEEGSGSQSR